MAQPEPYTRQFDFADFQSVNPTSPLPGEKVDLELNTAKITLDQILQNLSLIQRDDGRLMNGSVGQEQLAAGLSIGFSFKGVWATNVVYALSDGVSLGSKFYRAKASHLSDNTNAPNVSALFWEFLFDFATLVQQALTPTLRVPVANVNYTVQISDRLVAYTSLTAARAVALPSAAAFPAGVYLGIVDESGSCSGTNTITANVNGGDTINGAASYVLSTARAYAFFESDGISKWTIIVASALLDLSVSTAKIQDQAVTTAKIADNSVTSAKVPAAALPTSKLATLGGLPGLTLIGSEAMWPGIRAPSGWLFEFGQPLSRTTYAALFAALTELTTGNISNTSAVISGVTTDFTGLGLAGSYIEGPGIPLGTTVASLTSNSITMSAPATAGATGASIRLYGTCGPGDGSTNFTLPDARGYAIVARDNMGGSAAGRVTVFDATRLGNAGGEQTHLLLTSEMPAHNHPLVEPNSGQGHKHDIKESALASGPTAAEAVPFAGGSTIAQTEFQVTGLTMSNTGGGGTHNNVQPSVTRNIIIYAGV